LFLRASIPFVCEVPSFKSTMGTPSLVVPTTDNEEEDMRDGAPDHYIYW
jgi:hypothetical protein